MSESKKKLEERDDLSVFSIGELAEKAGTTRRVVRFYVQRELIPPPVGKGRGSHYSFDHLVRIQRILLLQAEGYSLDEIKTLQTQGLENPKTHYRTAPEAEQKSSHRAPRHIRTRAQMRTSAEVWTRIELLPGIELNINNAQHQLLPTEIQDLIAVIEKHLDL